MPLVCFLSTKVELKTSTQKKCYDTYDTVAVKFGHPKQHLGTLIFVLKVSKDERPSISFKTSPHLTPTV